MVRRPASLLRRIGGVSSLVLGLAVLGWQPALAQPATPYPVENGSTRDFLRSLGVNTHLEYTDGTYANYPRVIADLDFIGIHLLRDATPAPAGGVPYANYITALHAAALAGNHFDFIASPGQTLATSLNAIESVQLQDSGSVVAVEGPNEINNAQPSYRGLHQEIAARVFQRDLFAAVRASASISHAPVYLYTGGTALSAAQVMTMADATNQHPYPVQSNQPGQHIENAFAGMFGRGPYRKVITEIGYYSQPGNPAGGGVDETVQAKGTLNLLFDAFAQGIETTYLYQLLSAYPNAKTNTDTAFGLFRLDNTPRPAALALHALTTILADAPRAAGTKSSAAAVPRVVIKAIRGLPTIGHHLLLQKRPGVYDLVVWSEPAFWDNNEHRAILVPPTKVAVELGATARTVKVFDPLLGPTAIASKTSTSLVAIEITDHPVVVEIDFNRKTAR
jgi:hypothetical protein